jgi:CMP-N-acetylneuraminic acid synthetase
VKFLAIIPARGGSRGVARKNIRLVAGEPLIAYTIEAALAAPLVTRVIVSTEDDEIAEISRGLGAEVPFMRPAELAMDETPTLSVLQHAVDRLRSTEGYEPDAVITLQPTSPLRTARHIEEAIVLFNEDPNADSLVSCVEVPHIFHPRSVMRMNAQGYLEPYLAQPQPTRRQAKEKVVARNGAAIYITRIDRIQEYVFGGNLLAYYMDQSQSMDIDDETDLQRAEAALVAAGQGSRTHGGI